MDSKHKFMPCWERLEYVGCHYDWVRMIIPSQHYPCSLEGIAMREELYKHAGETARGNRIKPFGVSGFKGFRLGRVAIAVRGDLIWLEYSGDSAGDAIKLPYFDYANITRLDTAVDLMMPEPRNELAEYMRDYYKWYRNTYPKQGGYPKYDFRDSESEQTLYIGSRDSWRFMRFYNKSAEQGWPLDVGQFWRIEVQHQKEKCNELSHGLQNRLSLARTPYDLVSDFMSNIGQPLLCGFSSQSVLWDSSDRPSSDAERTLAWLKRQVRGSIAKLAREGYYDEAEHALGLYTLDTRK